MLLIQAYDTEAPNIFSIYIVLKCRLVKSYLNELTIGLRLSKSDLGYVRAGALTPRVGTAAILDPDAVAPDLDLKSLIIFNIFYLCMARIKFINPNTD